ncbi:uncharacterized protein [Engystomops pustulosus]|uniref:uncharacterized protein n=1 Tax=Engystomops pustulosus TaxID=76066 RepID=UPI003AFA843F
MADPALLALLEEKLRREGSGWLTPLLVQPDPSAPVSAAPIPPQLGARPARRSRAPCRLSPSPIKKRSRVRGPSLTPASVPPAAERTLRSAKSKGRASAAAGSRPAAEVIAPCGEGMWSTSAPTSPHPDNLAVPASTVQVADAPPAGPPPKQPGRLARGFGLGASSSNVVPSAQFQESPQPSQVIVTAQPPAPNSTLPSSHTFTPPPPPPLPPPLSDAAGAGDREFSCEPANRRYAVSVAGDSRARYDRSCSRSSVARSCTVFPQRRGRSRAGSHACSPEVRCRHRSRSARSFSRSSYASRRRSRSHGRDSRCSGGTSWGRTYSRRSSSSSSGGYTRSRDRRSRRWQRISSPHGVEDARVPPTAPLAAQPSTTVAPPPVPGSQVPATTGGSQLTVWLVTPTTFIYFGRREGQRCAQEG